MPNQTTTARYYPQLSEIVDGDKLPEFIKVFIVGDPNDINEPGILDKFHYRNLQVTKSLNGDAASYSLDLISKEEIRKEIIPGLGVFFVLNPIDPANPTSRPVSAFPISLKYEWPILGLIKEISTTTAASFLEDPLLLFEKAAEVFNLTGEELLANAFNLFVIPVDSSTTKYEQAINDINATTEYSSYLPTSTIPTSIEELSALVDAEIFSSIDPAKTNKHTLPVVLYNTYVKNSSNPDDNVRLFFQIIAPQGIESYLRDILIPKVYASLELSAGLEFPRDWMIPLDSSKNPISEDVDANGDGLGTPRATFVFAKSKLYFDTEAEDKFGFNADLALNPTDIVYVSLGKTGLIAGIKNLKIDIRDNKNIAEIAADGRPDSFKGVYVEECSVEFPPNWKVTNTINGDPPVITAKNLIMGSEGGVSGDISVEGANEEYFVNANVPNPTNITLIPSLNQLVVNGIMDDGKPADAVTFSYFPGLRNYYVRDKRSTYYLIDKDGEITSRSAPKGVLEISIGKEPVPPSTDDKRLVVSLNSFNLSIRQNDIINSSCVGTVTIPRKDKEGNPNPLIIQCTIEFNNGFLVKAIFPKEQAIVDNAFTTINLKGLELGRVNDANHFGFKGNAKINKAWPFLDRFLPKEIDVKNFVYNSEKDLDYEIGLGWKSGTNVTVSSDKATEIVIPIHKDTKKNDKRILSIKSLKVVAENKVSQDSPYDPYLSLAATFIEAQLNIKAVKVELSGLGFETQVSFPEDGGNMGPAETKLKFVAPTSGKISIDAKFIKGKGAIFYNENEGSFDGVLDLELTTKPKSDGATEQETPKKGKSIHIKGIVCLQTKMPDGSKGFSLLIILTAEFDAIELGMGFTLSGVGGLLGLNRTTNTDFLRTGLRDGKLESILFPKDPVKDAQKIISDVKSAFPVAKSRFVIGPLLKIGWGKPTLIDVDLGLFIEVPNPVVIALLGVAKANLPKEGGKGPIMTIKIAFLAVLDFGKKQFSLDASIYQSTFKGAELSGDLAVRLWWGENKLFLFTLGGFHPAFEAPPANLPTIRRLALTIRNDDKLRLWAQIYTAITSNTFQFGAELFLETGGKKYNAKARFWLDVLFQFNPFYFAVSIGAEAGIYRGSKSLLSAYLSLFLQGPSAYRAAGRAGFKVLGIGCSVSFDKSFGDETNERFKPVEIWNLIKDALNEKDAWESILPSRNNLLVSVKELKDETGTPVKRFHPLGSLQISQKVAPSNFLLEKYGNSEPSDIKKFSFTSVDLITTTATKSIAYEASKEDFAIADYKRMSDEQKLSAPSFIKKDNGVITTGFVDVETVYSIDTEVKYELIVVDKDESIKPIGIASLFDVTEAEYEMDVAFSTSSNNKFSSTTQMHGDNKPDRVKLSKPKYTLAKNNDLTTYETTPVWFDSITEAELYLDEISNGNSAVLESVQVVDNNELVTV